MTVLGVIATLRFAFDRVRVLAADVHTLLARRLAGRLAGFFVLLRLSGREPSSEGEGDHQGAENRAKFHSILLVEIRNE